MAYFRNSLLVWLLSIVILYSNDNKVGEEIFQTKCSSCHTIGKGKLVGPDLKGVTKRRDLAWLKKQIMTPDVLVEEGDETATQLVKEFGVPMANLGISAEEAEQLIAFFKEIDGGGTTAAVSSGTPKELLYSVIAGIVIMAVFTVIALRVGRKKVSPYKTV